MGSKDLMAAFAALLLGGLAALSACNPPAETEGSPAAPPRQEPARTAPAPLSGEQDLYTLLCKARGMPVEPPRTPAQNFSLEGRVVFQRGEGKEDLENGLLVWVGGPARLRYQLTSGGQANVFLLFSPEKAWLKVPGKEWTALAPATLLGETWLRWVVLRFPWGFRELLPARQALAGEGPRKRLELEGPQGPFALILDERFEPIEVRQGPVRLVLDDPATLPDGRRLPRQWTWTDGSRARIERFQSLNDRSLFLEQAFHPETLVPERSVVSLLPREGAAARPASDEFGLVHLEAFEALLGPPGADWTDALPKALLKPGRWQVLDPSGGIRAGVILSGNPPASLPPQVARQRISAGDWLRWATFSPLDPALAADKLRQAAAGSRLKEKGAAWVLVPPQDGRPHRRVVLLPVEPG